MLGVTTKRDSQKIQIQTGSAKINRKIKGFTYKIMLKNQARGQKECNLSIYTRPSFQNSHPTFAQLIYSSLIVFLMSWVPIYELYNHHLQMTAFVVFQGSSSHNSQSVCAQIKPLLALSSSGSKCRPESNVLLVSIPSCQQPANSEEKNYL